jgi:hypothetical protein
MILFVYITIFLYEPMKNSFSQLRETFLVECRSILGYSDSLAYLLC